ncbi:hypothetical protein M8J76_003514 [Diaphorina citri]|nr:hypothetical protein M8J76_003514 [Diaphorina citri]
MDKPQKIPKVAKVKNKAPAEIQITAEQLLREAKERDLEIVPPPPKQKISDPDELRDYQHRKRKAFEDNIRKNRMVISNWIKYAQWEESQKQVDRARSIYERALDVDHRNITLWLKYTELEMRNRQVNHARNLWDRAVTILPRANQFWYKYTYMEEMLENVAGARQAFERWMEWEPDEQAWLTYIKFELRYNEIDRARAIYSRFVLVHPDVKNWIRFARFEEQNGFVSGARKVYERAVEFFGEENLDEKLFIAFAKFEEGQREHERARVIYKYALDHIPKDRTAEIYKAYTIHEKKYGDRAGIEDVIVSKRKFQYEEEVNSNPNNYDAWFDYLRLLEDEGNADLIRETYERAIANIPPTKEKQFWRRYIYLWINYAVFEELEMEDPARTREVYKACLEVIPHKLFTFSKIWLYTANFEVRQKNLAGARKILGTGLGMCPKDKLFRGYIDLELQLREFDRCRILYQKFLEFRPENCITWMRFAELESLLGDMERARAIYELAISQPRLDMPELVWKAYIDFEVGQGERDKVWMNYAQFEMSSGDEDSVSLARRVFERANQALKASSEKEERVMLLEAWKEFEAQHGDDESRAKLNSKLPRRAKKRVKTYNDEGVEEGWEEVFDYIFPEDEAAKPNLKLLEKAKAWKKAMEEKQGNKIGEEGANKENEEEERDKERNREEEDERKDEGERDSDDERDDREEDSDSEEEKEREVETEH